MTETGDHALAFAMAALAPAVLTGLVFIGWGAGLSAPGGIGGALTVGAFAFIVALFSAGLHLGLLAVPLHALLSRGGPPGPGIVLASATLIGGLPLPLIFQGGAAAFMIFGLAGLIGGVAFCAVDWQPRITGDDE